jgi:hypothetical protein
MLDKAESRLWRPTHVEPHTEEEIVSFRQRWQEDPEGFAHRWSLNRFPNPNIARELSPDERSQRNRETALLNLAAVSKVKKSRGKRAKSVQGDEN